MIEVRYQGRLGNNMFQYCLGRILAEELGFALGAEPLPGLPNTNCNIKGHSFEEPIQVLSGQKIDLTRTRADPSPRRIILDGYFQRYEYYRSWRRKMQEWLAIDRAVVTPDVKPDVILNVRRTDYVQLGWALPFSYYEQALETILPQGGRVWIVTDDSRDPFFIRFAAWRPRFFNGAALEQMLFMTRSPRLVMSPSTFSWWPTFLGEPEEVVCPLPNFGIWSEAGVPPGVDLIERDRFTCLPCTKAYQATRLEAAYQRMRLMHRRVVVRANRTFHFGLTVPPQ